MRGCLDIIAGLFVAAFLCILAAGIAKSQTAQPVATAPP